MESSTAVNSMIDRLAGGEGLARGRLLQYLYELQCRFSYVPDTAIGRQDRRLSMVNGAFVHELADCRTFCRRVDVETMQAAGLALGGSLDNAVVVEGDRVLNPGGLRRVDEFVRHKMLDALGDLALAGAPILGAYRGVRAGHGATNRLPGPNKGNPRLQ